MQLYFRNNCEANVSFYHFMVSLHVSHVFYKIWSVSNYTLKTPFNVASECIVAHKTTLPV